MAALESYRRQLLSSDPLAHHLFVDYLPIYVSVPSES